MSPGHPRPRVPRLLALLLVAAGTAATRPRQVNGVLGGSVLLSPALPPNKTVKEIEWSFSSGTGTTIQVAEFGPDGFERPDPKDRFKDRLEMVNKTALRIGVLERGDSGVYGARLKLHPALVEDQSFHLSVYEPVPTPEIQHQQLSLTAQGCNVTLRCWVPPGSGAQAAWQLGSSGRTRWGQLCEDGRSLCLAVPTGAFNSSYTCVARNPVQERGVSIQMDALCRHQGKIPPTRSTRLGTGSRHPPQFVPAETGGWQWWHACLALLPVAFTLGICLWRKRRRRRRRKKAAEGAPPRNAMPRRTPPGGGGAAGAPPHHLQPAAGSRAQTFAEPIVAGRGAPSPHDTGQERAPHAATG
ncbi:SLAM family member 7 isoform X2 [Grus americana]|uniref:SLAM family member 7 isoform X2 n=1 Tax=Grus americana TaxID=9117 RepID=UPI002407E9A6|nr:SLAM family member 7 isoform X2 [Grus americana]